MNKTCYWNSGLWVIISRDKTSLEAFMLRSLTKSFPTFVLLIFVIEILQFWKSYWVRFFLGEFQFRGYQFNWGGNYSHGSDFPLNPLVLNLPCTCVHLTKLLWCYPSEYFKDLMHHIVWLIFLKKINFPKTEPIITHSAYFCCQVWPSIPGLSVSNLLQACDKFETLPK